MFLRGLHVIRSLQFRLVFIFIFITIALIISAGVPLGYFIESSYYDTFKERIDKGFEAWTIKDDASKEEIIKYLKDERNAIYLFLVTEYKTYTIVDKRTNKIVYSSDNLFEENSDVFIEQILRSNNYLAALAGKQENKCKLIHIKDKFFFDYARQKGNYILYFMYDREEWVRTIQKFNNIIQKIIAVAILVSLVFGYILSKTITVPIINLIHKTRKIASGEFGQVLEVKSDDEIGKLTKSFNFMAIELKNTLTQISREKNKIETILNYMTDGIIAFNLKGEVIHANPASKRILDTEEINENFNEFSKKYQLGILLEEIIYIGVLSLKETNIMISDKFISVYFATFTDEEKKIEGIIAVMQDITEQYKLEKMRKEFVANVSHELRTPLTSIKSYTETLWMVY